MKLSSKSLYFYYLFIVQKSLGGDKMGNSDIKPQFLRASVIQSAVNAFTNKPMNTPVVPNVGNGKALVMEILKIFMRLSPSDVVNAVEALTRASLSINLPTIINSWDTPGMIGRIENGKRIFDSAATDATVALNSGTGFGQVVYDLTDGNGNGYLVGSKLLHLSIDSSANIVEKGAETAVLFRLIQVTAIEFAGILSGL